MRLLTVLFIATLLFGCGKEHDSTTNFKLNNPVDLASGKVMHNDADDVSIYLDSVLYDSRCPLGFNCYWEGNAKIRFNFINNHKVKELILNTYKQFRTDTIIDGYKITLVSLKPYPRSGVKTEQKDYSATVIINK